MAFTNAINYPVLTAQHAPLFWRYDLNFDTNPFLMERFGINAVLNAGAIKFNNKYCLMPAWKAMTANLFLLLPKVIMALTISILGLPGNDA